MKKQELLLRSVSILIIFLLVLCGIDLIRQGAHTGGVLAVFSPGWFASIAVFTTLALVAAALLLWAILNPAAWERQILGRSNDRMPLLRWTVIGFIAVLPAVLFLGPTGGFLTRWYFRLCLFALGSLTIASLLPSDQYPLWKRLSFAAILTGSIFGIGQRLVFVTDYPFKLGWSEGNRIWDYSLYFFRRDYEIVGSFTYPNYLTPGRHGLWGLPFLVPGVTIDWVRLWDAVLWFAPSLLLGWALFRTARVKLGFVSRVALILLTFLFLNQGPIYAPLVISAVIVALGYDSKKPVRSIIVTAGACFYAGISRWTWMVAPALWAVLLSLLETGRGEGAVWWRRLLWPAVYGVAGLAGGLLSQAAANLLAPRTELISSTTLSQPLLWYRLLPNPTYPQGVLPALLLAAGSALALLLWAYFAGRIRWDWLQILCAAGVLAATFAVGVVISVKIGGGNNLHNLDMFLLSTLFILAAGFRTARAAGHSPSEFPAFIYFLIATLVFIPSWYVLRTGGPLQLPSDDTVRVALRDIEDVVYARSHEGEILFLDQRQLLTFGEIQNVPVVMEHELKELTNRAMTGDPALFADYYADIESQRFSLIVTGHLPTSYTDAGHPFGEEDNAQYEFIYEPLFAYYEVVRHFEDVGVWLLVPIQAPVQ